MKNTKVTLVPLTAGDREQFILDNLSLPFIRNPVFRDTAQEAGLSRIFGIFEPFSRSAEKEKL